MNKTQLVDALAERIGDRRTAATAVDGLLETIVDTVGAGESVTITGFGVFESRSRAARVARNPRTGEAVDVPATTVPAFRAGAGFRTKVGGSGAPEPRATPARRTRSAAAEPAEPAKPARRGGKKATAATAAAENAAPTVTAEPKAAPKTKAAPKAKAAGKDADSDAKKKPKAKK